MKETGSFLHIFLIIKLNNMKRMLEKLDSKKFLSLDRNELGKINGGLASPSQPCNSSNTYNTYVTPGTDTVTITDTGGDCMLA